MESFYKKLKEIYIDLSECLNQLKELNREVPFYWGDKLGLIISIFSIETKLNQIFAMDYPLSYHRNSFYKRITDDLRVFIEGFSKDMERYKNVLTEFSQENIRDFIQMKSIIILFEASLIKLEDILAKIFILANMGY